MPQTRKSTAAAATGPGRQSKLSFAHRVTKPSAARAVGKDLTAAAPKPAVAVPEKTAPAPAEVVDIAADDGPEQQQEKEEEEEQEEHYTTEAAPAPVVKSAAELEAEQVSDAQVGRYWRSLESQRLAPRVHQGDLGVDEKVLRYFDVSSQYGPCIGISRIRRWNRAEKLGLRPPIEVLAVLLKEEKGAASRAHMDEIMNPSVTGPDLA
ncbi:hypothetical protein RB595_004214 [Gaeumannomyces hyphopodioides]